MPGSDAAASRDAAAERRVEHALASLDVRARVGQLNQRLLGWQAMERGPHGPRPTRLLLEEVERWSGLGAMYGLLRADAWSGRHWANGIRPEERAEAIALVSMIASDASPVGIRPLIVEEAPHGHQGLGGVTLPVNLAVAATWDPALLAEASAAVATGLAASGVHIALVSGLDLLRDPRWGRAEECFGESAHLAAEFTRALVLGMQGERRSRLGADGVAVVLKHLAAQGEAVGGRNGQSAVIGPRDLRELHLAMVRAGVAAGALGFMAAYNDIDGVPCCANHDLLTGYLRHECGFDGIVMADGLAVDRLAAMTGDVPTAARAALLAGVDLSLWDEGFTHLAELAEREERVAAAVDVACRRVLRLKDRFGLLAPAPEPASVGSQLRADETSQRIELATRRTEDASRRLAQSALVLLHDPAGTLPLSAGELGTVVVAGPFAEDVAAFLGDYVPPLPRTAPPGLSGALREALPAARVLVVDDPVAWAAVLRDADAVIVALGGTSHRSYEDDFADNGARVGGDSRATCGEGADLADVSMPDGQDELLASVRAVTSSPIVAVVVAGRPHVLTGVVAHADAVLWAGYPGPWAGEAIAAAILGRAEPSGRLPMTLPRHPSAVPVRHDDRHPPEGVYLDAPEPVLFGFGHGLRYRDVAVTALTACVEGPRVTVEAVLRNRSGETARAVVPLLAHRRGGEVLPRLRELLAFRALDVPAGEPLTVRWELSAQDCFAAGHGPTARTLLEVDGLTIEIRPT